MLIVSVTSLSEMRRGTCELQKVLEIRFFILISCDIMELWEEL